VGKKERAWRSLIAGAIFAVGIFYGSWWGLIGFIPLATAVFKLCPISAALGIDTCKEKESAGT
jgi:H+/gluconate symporter-like permease